MSEYIRWESDGIEVRGHRVTQFEQREEIVRCVDCRHLYDTMAGYECERWSGQYHFAEPDGFCAWGERRDA